MLSTRTRAHLPVAAVSLFIIAVLALATVGRSSARMSADPLALRYGLQTSETGALRGANKANDFAAKFIDPGSPRKTLTIDPKFSLQEVLHGSAWVDYADFGGSVALSSDGNTAIVGAAEQNSFEGAAHVFARERGSWNQQQQLILADADAGLEENFGYAVALSGDARTAFVRGRNWIYVFVRVGTNWVQLEKLHAPGAANSHRGDSMASSGDGNTVLAVAFGLNNTRPLYMFARVGAIWTRQLLPARGASTEDYFGGSVALSSDGNTALAGARGGVEVFIRAGAGWIQRQKLTVPSVAADVFWDHVALSGDGKTAVVGASDKRYIFTFVSGTWNRQQELPNFSSVTLSNDGSTVMAAAYSRVAGTREVGVIRVPALGAVVSIFTRTGATWTQKGELPWPPERDSVSLLDSIALSSGGNTALVGARSLLDQHREGSAYLFTLTGGRWSQPQCFFPPEADAARDESFGQSLALSSDGNTALVGAGERNSSFGGVAYVITRVGAKLIRRQKLNASDVVDRCSFGHSVALSSDGSTALVAAFKRDDRTQPCRSSSASKGVVHVFNRSGESWAEQQSLTGVGGEDSFGDDMALSSDGATAIVGAMQSNNFTGAVYIFTRTGGTWAQQLLTVSDLKNNDRFGSFVAMSGDGNTAFATADPAVYVFKRVGNNWTQQQKLTASDVKNHVQQWGAVALSGDGNTAVIAGTGTDKHAVYVFTQASGRWSTKQELTAVDARSASNNGFGSPLALSRDGNTILVAAPSQFTWFVRDRESVHPEIGGAVYVFTRAGVGWAKGAIIPPITPAQRFARSLALSGDGRIVVVAASAMKSGNVFVFTVP